MLASVPLLISSPSFVKHIPSLPKEGIKGAFKDKREIYSFPLPRDKIPFTISRCFYILLTIGCSSTR